MTLKPLSPGATLYDVVRAIESTSFRTAVIVDDDGRLLGTLTDGDVRRCLLGGELKTRAEQAMNTSPVTALAGSPDGYLLDLMKSANIRTVPLVDDAGRYVSARHLTQLSIDEDLPVGPSFEAAVIMAGGQGTRLRPLTEKLPKPMVDIHGVPLLERQVRRLVSAGISRIYLSINYLGHVIEEYFGDGSQFGVAITYLREDETMGTGGALSLLPDRPKGPVVVMNGDILTTFDFAALSDFHQAQKAEVTVSAVDYHVQIPFGVLRSEGPRVTALEEKPSQHFLCNAGIYALSPSALDLVPAGFYNMTDLIRDCLEGDRRVCVFPVHEFWSDIGTPADLDKARAAFAGMAGESK